MADKGEGEAATRETGVTVAAGQRLKLQTGYGQAMAVSRGFAAEETKAAVARAQQLAAQIDESSDRFAAYYGQWAIRFNGGELLLAREIAENFLREARSAGGASEIATGRPFVGTDVASSRRSITSRERISRRRCGIYDPAWSCDTQTPLWFGFGNHFHGDPRPSALAVGGGRIRPRARSNRRYTRAVEARHVPTLANSMFIRGLLGNASRRSRSDQERRRDSGRDRGKSRLGRLSRRREATPAAGREPWAAIARSAWRNCATA